MKQNEITKKMNVDREKKRPMTEPWAVPMLKRGETSTGMDKRRDVQLRQGENQRERE